MSPVNRYLRRAAFAAVLAIPVSARAQTTADAPILGIVEAPPDFVSPDCGVDPLATGACFWCGKPAAPVYSPAPAAPVKAAPPPAAPAKNAPAEPPAAQPVYSPAPAPQPVYQVAPPTVAPQPVYYTALQPVYQAPAPLTVRPAGPIRLAIANFGDWLSQAGDGSARVPRQRPAPVYVTPASYAPPAPVYAAPAPQPVFAAPAPPVAPSAQR